MTTIFYWIVLCDSLILFTWHDDPYDNLMKNICWAKFNKCQTLYVQSEYMKIFMLNFKKTGVLA